MSYNNKIKVISRKSFSEQSSKMACATQVEAVPDLPGPAYNVLSNINVSIDHNDYKNIILLPRITKNRHFIEQ